MTLEEVVFQGLGEASMCWSETPKGVFDSEHATRIGNEIMQAIKEAMHEDDDPGLPVKNPLPAKPPMPNPTERDLQNSTFEAIWQVIKTWEVNVPEYYVGYCGANGSHVKLILDAIRADLEKRL
jgi:hypothetical protein